MMCRQGEREVGGRGGARHLLGFAAADPAVLVVLGQHAGVAVAQPQAGLLFPGGVEPDRFGEPGVAEGAGEQGHAAAVVNGRTLALDAIGGAGAPVQPTLAGRAVASTGSATEEASQSGIV